MEMILQSNQLKALRDVLEDMFLTSKSPHGWSPDLYDVWGSGVRCRYILLSTSTGTCIETNELSTMGRDFLKGCSFETFKLECIWRQFWRNKYTSSCQATWCYDRFCPWLGIYGEAWEWCETHSGDPEMSDSGGTVLPLVLKRKTTPCAGVVYGRAKDRKQLWKQQVEWLEWHWSIQLGMEC